MSRFIHLNTRDRNEGINGDATFYILSFRHTGVQQLTIESIQFPQMLYPFSVARQNYIIYFQEDGSDVVPLQAELQVDTDYNGATLSTEIADKMTAASTGGHTYTVTYSTSTKRFTATTTGTSFRLVDAEKSAHFELGYNIADPVFYNSLTFAFPVDVSGTKYVDLVSNIGSSANYNSSGTFSPIARIPLLESFGEAVIYSGSLRQNLRFNENDDVIRLQLRDDRGRLVDLPDNAHVSYSFSLQTVNINTSELPAP
jgi:hypothetical protein